MKKNCNKYRIIYLGFLFIIFFFLFGSFSYSYEDIYLFDDLKIGDFLLNGTTIIIDYDYHDASMYYEENVYICYQPYEKDVNVYYPYCEEVPSRSKVNISNYQEVFGNDFSFEGWIVSSAINNSLYIKPASSGSEIVVRPNFENEYTLEMRCINSVNPLNKWYKYEIIDNISLEGNVSLLWNFDSDELVFREFSTNPIDYIDTFTLSFSANKDQILFFESKLFLKDYYSSSNMQDEMIVLLDGEELNVLESDFYHKNYFVIPSDGDHTLSFEFKKVKSAFSYMHVKNLRILSYLGDANQLDISNLDNEDLIYYEAICDDYLMSGNTNIVKEEIELESDIDNENNKENDHNPSTEDYVVTYFVISFIAFLFLLFIIMRIKYKNFCKVNCK
ncbi:MAG: hypothetical protein ACI4XM_08795 [Candidatus Coprovivens sp.]